MPAAFLVYWSTRDSGSGFCQLPILRQTMRSLVSPGTYNANVGIEIWTTRSVVVAVLHVVVLVVRLVEVIRGRSCDSPDRRLDFGACRSNRGELRSATQDFSSEKARYVSKCYFGKTPY